MREKIKICGAGLSGLCAAINLAKNGFEAEVYEANQAVGAAKNGDWQGLENWTAKEDVLSRIKTCGIEVDFFSHPFREVKFYSSDLTAYPFKSEKPFFYVVKRGSGKGSLDWSLARQAEARGVKINYGCSLKPNKADITATGGQKPFALALGLNFTTNLDDQVVTILSDDLAPKTYAYLIAVNGEATLVSGLTLPYVRQAKFYFKKTFETFQKIRPFSVKNEKKFAGVINTGFKPEKGKIYTGEAGGFQDYLLGFGMYHALRSGYLAALALIEKKPYKVLTDRELGPLLKASRLNRFIYERLGNRGYKIFLSELNKNPDIISGLNKLYTHNFSKITMLKKLARYVQNKD
ncbi:MAG: NAD(P)-binding protein [Patescibacteria group bacterium]